MIFDFSIVADVFPGLVVATTVTLSLTLWILVFGIALGIPMGLLNNSPNKLFQWMSELYILVFRGTPPLVQLFVVYFGLAQFEAVRGSVFWPFLREAYYCAIIALGLNSAAYVGRMFSGALASIPVGQIEAARALGMGPIAIFLTVRAPLALRTMLPAYGNEVVMTLKATALASTITVQELMGKARSDVADTYAPYEVLLSAAVIYLALTFTVSKIFAYLETRLNPLLRQGSAPKPSNIEPRVATVNNEEPR